MLDYKFIKENLRDVKENVKNRRVDADPEFVAELYNERNGLIHDIEDLRKRRNENASGMKRKLSSDEREKLIEEGKKLKTRISGLEKELEGVESKLYIEVLKIPNMSHPDAPLGMGEEDNREIKRWGTVPGFDFTLKDHVEIGKAFRVKGLIEEINITRFKKLKSDTSYYKYIRTAIKYFKTAINIDSLNAQAFVEYGDLLRNQKKYRSEEHTSELQSH